MITTELDRTELLSWWSSQGTPFLLTISGQRYRFDISAKQLEPNAPYSPFEQLLLISISLGESIKAESSMITSISFFQDGSFQVNDNGPDYVLPSPILPVIFRELFKRYCQSMGQI